MLTSVSHSPLTIQVRWVMLEMVTLVIIALNAVKMSHISLEYGQSIPYKTWVILSS